MSLVLTMVMVGASVPARNQNADADTRAWFQRTEQSLMDAVAVGDTRPWNAVMDDRCIVTTEEGEVLTKSEFLKDLHPLPPGLVGEIAVKDLTVDELPGLAIVRYVADEWETIFGQRLTTKYRVTDTFRQVRREWKIPLTPLAFVREGSLGEWLFVMDRDRKVTSIVNFRKFEPLIWTRVAPRLP